MWFNITIPQAAMTPGSTKFLLKCLVIIWICGANFCHAQLATRRSVLGLPERIPPVSGLDPLPFPSEVYSLSQLIDIGEKNNPTTRIAWEQAKQAADDVGIARSALFPLLDFTVMALKGNLLFGLPPNISSAGVVKINTSIIEPALKLTWTVFDFGGNRASYDQAKSLALASKMALSSAHEKVALQVSQNYFKLLASKEQLRAAANSNESSDLLESSVREQYSNGLATIVQLNQAKAQRLSAYSQFVKAKGSVATGRVSLTASVGLLADKAVDIAPLENGPAAELIQSSATELVQRALAHRPDMLEAVEEVRASQYEVKQARSDFFPKITLDAEEQYTRTSNSPGSAAGVTAASANSTNGSTYLVELSLTWNLFDAGARRSRYRQAQSQVREAQDKLKSTKIETEQQVWSAYVGVLTSIRDEDAAKASLDAAKLSFRSAQVAYSTGTQDFTTLAQAQTSLAQAESSYAEARTKTLEQATELAYSTGNLVSTGPQVPKQTVGAQ